MNSRMRLVFMSLTLLTSQCPLVRTYCSTFERHFLKYHYSVPTSSSSCRLITTLPMGSSAPSTISSSMLPDFLLFFLRPSNFCFLSSSVSTQVVFMPAASHSLQNARCISGSTKLMYPVLLAVAKLNYLMFSQMMYVLIVLCLFHKLYTVISCMTQV